MNSDWAIVIRYHTSVSPQWRKTDDLLMGLDLDHLDILRKRKLMSSIQMFIFIISFILELFWVRCLAVFFFFPHQHRELNVIRSVLRRLPKQSHSVDSSVSLNSLMKTPSAVLFCDTSCHDDEAGSHCTAWRGFRKLSMRKLEARWSADQDPLLSECHPK